MMKHIANSRGFTLIELLIVISIIGILTTIASVNFIGVRERARDGQRKTDLSQIQTALEFYRTDMGIYPLNFDSTACEGPFRNPTAGSTTVYMKHLPCDPSTQVKYFYTRTDNYNYTLTTCLENEEDKDRGTATGTHPNCTAGQTISYTVENP